MKIFESDNLFVMVSCNILFGRKHFGFVFVFLSVLETEVEGSLSVSVLTDSDFTCLENLWIGRGLIPSVETLQLHICLLSTSFWVWSCPGFKNKHRFFLWHKLNNWVTDFWIRKGFRFLIFSNIGTTISSRTKCAF